MTARPKGDDYQPKLPDVGAPAKRKVLVMSWGMPQVMRLTCRGLTQMGFQTQIVKRGGSGKPTWVQDAIDWIETYWPAYLFTWQRLYGEARPIWRTAQVYGVKQVVMDFGFWPHFATAIFDPQGENRESGIVGNFDALEQDAAQHAAINEAMPTIETIQTAMMQSEQRAPRVLNRAKIRKMPVERGFAFLALQRCVKGHPDKVLELDAVPSRHDPLRIAQDVIAECEKQNVFVVVKQHPQGVDIGSKIPEHGPHHWLMPMFRGKQGNELVFGWCIRRMSHLITVNSTTWSLALACGKPVSVLGRGWYSSNRVVNECKLIRDAIPVPESSGERGKRFVALMISRQVRHHELKTPRHLRKVLNLIHPGGF